MIHGLAYLFALLGKVSGAFVRREGSSDYLDAMLVGAGNELGKPLFQIFGAQLVIGLVRVVERANVVDAFQQNEVFDPGLRKNISIEAGKRVLSDAMYENAVTADAFIQHT